ncbi:MAG: PKD-like domain-containing protein, partial [Bacteroidota bacterium]
PEPILDPSLSPAPVCSDLPSMITLVEQAGTVAAASFNITGIAVQSGLIPGGSNSTIQDGVAANAIFSDSYTNTTNSSLTVTYTIAPVSATGCIGENAQVIFTINPAPEVADLNTITCSDETSEIQLTTSSGSAVAANYEIIDIRPAAGLVPNAGNASIGFTGSNIDYIRNDIFTNPTDNPLTVEYDIAPISGPGCRGPLQVVVLTVEAQPTVIPAPDEAICSQDPTSITLQSNTVPTSGNVTFSVTVSSSGAVTGFTPVRQNLPQGFVIDDTPRNLDNTVSTLTYTITPQMFSAKNGVGCTSGTPIVVTVNVEPEPKLEFSETFISICEGVSLDDINNILSTPTTPSAGNVEFVLNGDPVATGGVTGFSLGGTVYSPGDEITDTFDNPSSANQTVTYRFTPRIVGSTSGTCVGDDVNLVVTVTPRPVVIPDPADLIPSIARPTIEVCSSEPRTIDLPIDIANGISSWTVTDNPDVDGEFESLGNSLFLSLINNSDVPQTITYTVTPFSLFDNSCTGDPIEIDVIVNPLPEVDIFDASPVRCSGDEAGIPLQGVGNFFTWEAQVVSGTVNLPTVSGVGSNGDLIDHVLDNNGTTPAIVRYTIRAFYNKLNADDPGEPQCEGFAPGFVTLTLSPPVNAQITPDPEVGQNTRFRCAGNTEAIEFELFGTAPFQLILDRAENGVITRETLTDLPSRHIILATESVSYTIVRVEDANGCEEFPIDNVDIIFEEALADFEVQYTDPDNGFAFTKNPPQVQMLPNGTATIDIRINNFNPSNIYEFSIGEDIIPVTGPNLTYTFIEPSPFGSIGFLAELNVESPNVSIPCNDSESYFIQVVPAPAIVLAVSDITEGCAPLTVNFESFREDLSLSRNIIVDELVWDFDDGRPTLISPNPTYTFTEAGAYNVVVRGTNGYPGEGNEDQASITIVVQSNPVADFRSNQDVIFIPDQAFRPINNSSTFVTDWLWDWGDGNFTSGTTDEGAATPEHVYELEGQYKVLLTASTDYGNGIVCSDTASLVVTVEEGGFTRTPNAFTPNIDGPPGGSFDPLDPGTAGNINDVFLPITEGVVEFQMVIFDRWGNLVFESNDRNFGWDGYDSKGNLFPAGVYVYRLDLLLSDGNRTTRVGDVTLIR